MCDEHSVDNCTWAVSLYYGGTGGSSVSRGENSMSHIGLLHTEKAFDKPGKSRMDRHYSILSFVVSFQTKSF